MRTDQERILLMHRRAEELHRQTERRKMRYLSVSCVVLCVCLTGLTMMFSGIGHGMMTGTATATSLLEDSAGGYVLAAVLAFTAGVLITVILMRRRTGTQSNGFVQDDAREDPQTQTEEITVMNEEISCKKGDNTK